ncbi:cation:proton antiporter [soil metagenome]
MPHNILHFVASMQHTARSNETGTMAGESAAHYREFLILLAAAGIVVPLFIRLGISTVLGFLIVGIILSHDVLGSLAARFPFIQTFILPDDVALESLGELGVVFLLFLIGLELSFERLKTMRRIVFGLGGLQVIISTAVLALAAWYLNFNGDQAIILGMALALSSTAIVIQLLSDEKRLGTQTGRLSFAILLFQDLAVVPILLTVSMIGRQSSGPMIQDIALALGQAALAILVIVTVGRFALRPILRQVARANSPDLFMAATLLIAVGTGVLANAAGLSMALGAFIAGLMLAETEYRRSIEATIEPFKGLLLGAFFLLVGLRVHLADLLHNPLLIIGTTIVLIAIKVALIYALARAFRIGRHAAFEAALLLGPCGEFAFVVINSALALNILQTENTTHVLLIVSLSMILIPLIARVGRRITRRGRHRVGLTPEALAPPPDDHQPRVIVAGFGRVGRLVGSMLEEQNIPYIAVDSDPDLVTRERRNGRPVYFGDAAQPEFLHHCGIGDARAIAITMDTGSRVDDVARVARAERADLKIIARARDDRHAQALYAIGVTEAVPETIEASLQLGEAILVESGVPIGLAIAAVHERRDANRRLLNRPNRKEELNLQRRKKVKT